MSAEAVKTPMGPYIINCQAPDEGNMHTLLHFGTEAQKETWLRPLCEGTMRSCFSMTEPDAAGSDPTQIPTSAVKDGDEWVMLARAPRLDRARRIALRLRDFEDR
jgi:acyl-CoA dehydrogenase